MTDDWSVVSDEVKKILSEKFREIRRDISAEEIMEKVAESLSSFKPSGISMDVSGVDIDMSMVVDLLQKYNDRHREKILKLANSLGSVFGEEYALDEDHILIEINDMRIKIKKDIALKISALGFVPFE